MRVSISVMLNDVMAAFSIGAAAVGTISAFYFYAYAPMQLPVGFLLDRFGARSLLSIGSLLCGLGGILFGISHYVWHAELGRLLMGAGSAFAFISFVYICSHWFAAKRLAMLVGLGNSLSMLGAVAGQGPMSLMVESLGWREMEVILGIIGVIIAIVIFCVVKNKPVKLVVQEKPNIKKVMSDFGAVCKNKHTWFNGVTALLFYAVTSSFGGLWAVPFIENVYKTSIHVASFGASMIYFGWIVGGPLIGHFSDKIDRRRPMLIIFSLIACILLSIVIAFPIFPIWLLFALMFVIGACASAELLTYSLSIEINIPSAKGSALAITNFLVFCASTVLQPFVGWLLDLHWNGKMVDGAPSYSAMDYQVAMIIFPVTLFLSFLFAFFIDEKQRKVHISSSEQP
jgi:MFS family permease